MTQSQKWVPTGLYAAGCLNVSLNRNQRFAIIF